MPKPAARRAISSFYRSGLYQQDIHLGRSGRVGAPQGYEGCANASVEGEDKSQKGGARVISKYVVQADWETAPHLSPEARAALISSYPPHERDARTKGIPQLGSGAIYPVPESEIVIDPITLPPYWPRAYALDVGWNRTAALWMAYDPEGDVIYLYSEHYRGQAEPPIHAAAIKARGTWMNGVIDPAARGRSQADGTQLLSLYVDLGLNLSPADNAVEAGIYDVWSRLSSGRLKAFNTLVNFLAEYRMYRRNEKGQVVKENDHLMDCARYIVRSGIAVATANLEAFRRSLPKTQREEGAYDPFARFLDQRG